MEAAVELYLGGWENIPDSPVDIFLLILAQVDVISDFIFYSTLYETDG